MPGNRDPVGGGIRATDNGGGTHLPGATEGTGLGQGVQRGDGGRIFGGAQYDAAWASGRGETELENLGHGGRAADVLHRFHGQGRPAELPCGEMPRPSGDKDGDTGPFPTPACPGHRGHFGGGKPSPATVPPMRHAGPPACTEQKASCHCTVASRGGSEGEHGETLRGIQVAARKYDGV